MKKAALILAILTLCSSFTDERNFNSNAFRVILEPIERTKLSAEIRSPIVSVNKKMGEAFEAGEVLIQFENEVFKGNLTRGEAEVEKTWVELEGRKKLYQDKVSSLFDLKKSEADYIKAESELLDAYKKFYATKIIAPYPGKVVSVNIKKYELAEIGRNLIEIINDHILVAKMYLPSYLLKSISLGDTITVRIQETGQIASATITHIGAAIDPASSTFPLEANIDNYDHQLTAGMKGWATLDKMEGSSDG